MKTNQLKCRIITECSRSCTVYIISVIIVAEIHVIGLADVRLRVGCSWRYSK